MLVPSEAGGMTTALAAKKVPMRPTSVNTARASEQLTPALQALLSRTPELKVRRGLQLRLMMLHTQSAAVLQTARCAAHRKGLDQAITSPQPDLP